MWESVEFETPSQTTSTANDPGAELRGQREGVLVAAVPLADVADAGDPGRRRLGVVVARVGLLGVPQVSQ